VALSEAVLVLEMVILPVVVVVTVTVAAGGVRVAVPVDEGYAVIDIDTVPVAITDGLPELLMEGDTEGLGEVDTIADGTTVYTCSTPASVAPYMPAAFNAPTAP
jgi:hypothetical protein